MADGNAIIHGRILSGHATSTMTLGEADRHGHVVAFCPDCSTRENCDPAWLKNPAERQASLGSIGGRLRCVCSGRRLTVEVWPVSPYFDEPSCRRTFLWR